MNSIGDYLKEARNKCRLSLKDVHDRCGVTDSKLSRMKEEKESLLIPLN